MKISKSTLSFLQLLKDARDARIVRKAEQSLLYHLILRCDPNREYSCFPSYELLCADTGLDSTTLKRAAAKLEERQFVSRQSRFKQSNLWYINAALIHDLADVARAEEKKSSTSTSPFAPPILEEIGVIPRKRYTGKVREPLQGDELLRKLVALVPTTNTQTWENQFEWAEKIGNDINRELILVEPSKLESIAAEIESVLPINLVCQQVPYTGGIGIFLSPSAQASLMLSGLLGRAITVEPIHFDHPQLSFAIWCYLHPLGVTPAIRKGLEQARNPAAYLIKLLPQLCAECEEDYARNASDETQPSPGDAVDDDKATQADEGEWDDVPSGEEIGSY